MRTREKVAISIPRDLLDAVERLRKRSGETRSAVFERALADYLAGAQAASESRRYVAAYRRSPESAAAQRAALASSLEALASEPWDA
jgi:metal-responsive CopG/Arc/MetJ family transcriptional regulator